MAAKWISKAFFGKESSSGEGEKPPEDSTPLSPHDEAHTNGNKSAQTEAETAPMRDPDLDKTVVLLLYGKNSFGDQIYSYLKITIAGIEELKRAILVGKGFNPSDFGTIIAAGKGEPSAETRAEVSSMYQVLSAAEDNTSVEAVKVTEKKSWDEY